MKFRVDEISSVITEEIRQYRSDVDLGEVGQVLEVGDGIARIYGLDKAMAGELLEFENGAQGQVFNLEETSVGSVVLGDYLEIKEGHEVRRTGELASIPVGDAMVGRVVDPLGRPLDGLGPIETPHRRPLEFKAPGIAARQGVTEPLQTGLKAVDSMIPIGRGQRELIIGDRKTGKTAIAIDTIINQKDSGDVICVYVAVGQKESTVVPRWSRSYAKEHGAMDYTIVVSASASDRGSPSNTSRPYAGAAICRVLHVPARAAAPSVDLRRSVEAGAGLSAAFASPASRPPGPRSLSGRRLLPSLAAPRAQRSSSATSTRWCRRTLRRTANDRSLAIGVIPTAWRLAKPMHRAGRIGGDLSIGRRVSGESRGVARDPRGQGLPSRCTTSSNSGGSHDRACRSSRPSRARSRPTSRPTSSRSPTDRSTWSRTSSSPAFARRSTSASASRGWAATPRSRR